MYDVINTLTERLEGYSDDITDCCGDHVLFGELMGRIDELKFVLDLLVDAEDHKKSWHRRHLRRKLYKRR